MPEPAPHPTYVVVSSAAGYAGGSGLVDAATGTGDPTDLQTAAAHQRRRTAQGEDVRVEEAFPQTPFERARQRVSFQMSYKRAERHFAPDGITGDPIDCAFRPGKLAPGGWDVEDWMFAQPPLPGDDPEDIDPDRRPVTEHQWMEMFFTAALSEAIHETLEWFQVDGRPLLNPHGPLEHAVHTASAQLAEHLFALAHSAKPAYEEMDLPEATASADFHDIRRRLAAYRHVVNGDVSVETDAHPWRTDDGTRWLADDDNGYIAALRWPDHGDVAVFLANAATMVEQLLAAHDATKAAGTGS